MTQSPEGMTDPSTAADTDWQRLGVAATAAAWSHATARLMAIAAGTLLFAICQVAIVAIAWGTALAPYMLLIAAGSFLLGPIVVWGLVRGLLAGRREPPWLITATVKRKDAVLRKGGYDYFLVLERSSIRPLSPFGLGDPLLIDEPTYRHASPRALYDAVAEGEAVQVLSLPSQELVTLIRDGKMLTGPMAQA